MYYVYYNVDYESMGGVDLKECKTDEDLMNLIEELKREFKDSIDWNDVKCVNDHITIISGNRKKLSVKTIITEYTLE